MRLVYAVFFAVSLEMEIVVSSGSRFVSHTTVCRVFLRTGTFNIGDIAK